MKHTTVVIGPSGAGKSTWVQEVAQLGDLVVDLDRLVVALSNAENGWVMPSNLVAKASLDARRAAMKVALANQGPQHAYIIHACPTVEQFKSYRGLYIRVIDPGRELVSKRLTEQAGRAASLAHVSKWYDECLPALFASGLLRKEQHEAARNSHA